jgi:hypothetical protein
MRSSTGSGGITVRSFRSEPYLLAGRPLGCCSMYRVLFGVVSMGRKILTPIVPNLFVKLWQ